MAEMESLDRTHPLAGRSFGRPGVTLTPAAPASRLSLRAPARSVAALSEALGLALPSRPKSSASAAGRSALWLGPDEWLLIDEAGGNPAAAAASCAALHSAVDVSHRNTAILVEGPGAEATISAGCPQDLTSESFPVGACSRTILGKIEIIVWRRAEHSFRVECWRSFSDYAWTYLQAGARDAAIVGR